MRKLFIVIPILFLLTLCSPMKEITEVPVEVVKTEYIHDTKIDSIFVRDSIDRYIKGDTVFIYKEHTRFKYLNRIDTIVKVDSIPKIIRTVTVKEVNHIKGYQKVLMWTGGTTIALLIGIIIYKIKF